MLQQALLEVLRAARQRPATWRIFLVPADGMPLVFWGLGRLDLRDLDAELTTAVLIAATEQGIRLALTGPEHFSAGRLMTIASGIVTAFVAPRQA